MALLNTEEPTCIGWVVQMEAAREAAVAMEEAREAGAGEATVS